jgi:hypothetical protein
VRDGEHLRCTEQQQAPSSQAAEAALETDDALEHLAGQLQRGQLRATDLQRKLASAEALAGRERDRVRREAKTGRARGKQAERRDTKATIQKRKAGRVDAARRAARKEGERARTGTQPTSAPLHSSERKHRQLLGGRGGGARHGGSRSGGKGGKGKGY